MSVRTPQPTPTGTPAGDVLLSDLVLCARAAADNPLIASLSSAAVAAAMKDLKKIRGAVSAVDAALRTRARELQPTPDPDPFPTPTPPKDKADPLPDSGEQVDVSPPLLDYWSGITSRTGKARDRFARVLAQMPSIEIALSSGEISEHHVDELAKILFSATDHTWAAITAAHHEIADVASRMEPVGFARHLSLLIQRIAAESNVDLTRDLEAEISASLWIDRDTGLGRLSATFDPHSFNQLEAIIAKAAAKLMRNNKLMTKKQATGRALLNYITKQGTTGHGEKDTSSGANHRDHRRTHPRHRRPSCHHL
jgi:flagellar biosynthesis regulator FlaF